MHIVLTGTGDILQKWDQQNHPSSRQYQVFQSFPAAFRFRSATGMGFKHSIINIPNVNILLPGQRTYSLMGDMNFVSESKEKKNSSQFFTRISAEIILPPVQNFFALLHVVPIMLEK
jgi:hypothetical protein